MRIRPRIAALSSLASVGLMALVALLTVAGRDGRNPVGEDLADRFVCSSCNLVLISLDTLRADHVSAYGYPQETTPFIDRWAEDAIVFESAFATAPKTAESHMSVFTGLYPEVHRVFTVGNPAQARPDQIHRLSDRISTLPEVLKQSGYHTVGFHGGGNVAARFGFEHEQFHNEILKVPLIIAHPRLREGIRVRSRVNLVDLLPTLLEMLEMDADLPVQGSSFLPLLATDRTPREIYSEHPPFFLYTLIVGDKKLILHGLPSRDMNSCQRVEFYDLHSDPAEKRNLAGGNPDLQEMFERLTERVFETQALGNAIRQGDPPATESLEEETIEQLEALGYLE